MSLYLLIILIISHVIVASTPSLDSATLSKREDSTCDDYYGSPIASDCRAAKNKILHWEPFHKPSSSDYFTFLMGAFEFFTANARHNPVFPILPRAYLPAFFTSGGCEVAMVMKEGITDMDSPLDAYEQANTLTIKCVEEKLQGGYNTIGVHHNIYLYMYALDSDYVRLRDRKASCAQASTSGQSNVDCSNLQGPISDTGSSGTQLPSSNQGSPSSTCSRGYSKHPSDCCQGFSSAWSVLAAARASIIFGIKDSIGEDIVGWCQHIDITP